MAPAVGAQVVRWLLVLIRRIAEVQRSDSGVARWRPRECGTSRSTCNISSLGPGLFCRVCISRCASSMQLTHTHTHSETCTLMHVVY